MYVGCLGRGTVPHIRHMTYRVAEWSGSGDREDWRGGDGRWGGKRRDKEGREGMKERRRTKKLTTLEDEPLDTMRSLLPMP